MLLFNVARIGHREGFDVGATCWARPSRGPVTATVPNYVPLSVATAKLPALATPEAVAR